MNSSYFWLRWPTWLFVLHFAQESFSVIKHCNMKTNTDRQAYVKDYQLERLEAWLFQNEASAGRVGTLKFVTWQDPVLEIKSNGLKCKRWRMIKGHADEVKKFNDKVFTGDDLHADPTNCRHYHRVIACETDNCVQVYNVISRPITRPDFPVQIYQDKSQTITCDLGYMEDRSKKFFLTNHQPPYRFEWTAPADCKPSYFDKKPPDDKGCVRYSWAGAGGVNTKCGTEDPGKGYENIAACTVDLIKKYPKTHIKYETKQLKNENGKNGNVTHFKANLVIGSAKDIHKGQWRCLVYDNLGVSSWPDQEGVNFFRAQSIIHRGVVFIHVKEYFITIGIPLGLIGVLLLLVIFSILLCKQCTDYDVDPGKAEAEDKNMAAEVAHEASKEASLHAHSSTVATAESKTGSVAPH